MGGIRKMMFGSMIISGASSISSMLVSQSLLLSPCMHVGLRGIENMLLVSLTCFASGSRLSGFNLASGVLVVGLFCIPVSMIRRSA